MTHKDDGGPAFPEHKFEHYGNGAGRQTMHGGMTLRDWFAGQALSAAASVRFPLCEEDIENCYRYADAMLAARNNTNENKGE